MAVPQRMPVRVGEVLPATGSSRPPALPLRTAGCLVGALALL